VTRWLLGGPYDEETARARSARDLARYGESWATRGWSVWALIDRASGRLIGECGLLPLPESPDVELVYLLERDGWGRGLAAEAGREVLRCAFTRLGLPRVVAVTHPEHRASRRVMEKVGMSREADRQVSGLHAVCYAVSREAFAREG
jgi:ribosomal-protein-alanine N-acetyltransferase